MAGHSPEQVKVSEHTRSINPLRIIHCIGTGIANEFRAAHEQRQLKQRSERYVDALFDCYISGAITGSQLNKNLPPDDERCTRLGINRGFVFDQAIHRTVMLYLDGYLPLESFKGLF